MNDFSEIEYGTSCLDAALKTPAGDKLKRLLGQKSPEIAATLGELDALLPLIRDQTYILCLSEHLASEQHNGRLSMWRGYGGATDAVAVILNSAPFFNGTADISPVGYLTEQQFFAEFSQVVDRLPQIMTGLPEEMLKARLMMALTHAVMCTKHPGFAEEREWRVIYRPVAGVPSAMIPDRVNIKGFEEEIYKVPLKTQPDLGIRGIEISDLIDRIIIGPSDQPDIVRNALVELLRQRGVASPEQRIVISGIPFRRTIPPPVPGV